jgi:hypothetical protein
LLLILLIIMLVAGLALLIWGLHDYSRRVQWSGRRQTAVVYCVPNQQML